MSRTYLLWIALFAAACGSADDTTDTGEVSEALTGQNGVLNVTAANTVVNQYGVLAANAAAGATSITVTTIADFAAGAPFVTALAAGDLLMLYQPQGATIDASDTATYGNVTAQGGAGTYELVHVASVAGTTINLETGCSGLRFAYTTAGATQVIRVPQATTLTISGAGSLTAPPWNGVRGGVVAVHAQTTATINGAGIDVTGRGFRGGAADDVTTNPPGTSIFRSASNAAGAEKGEGIAGFQTRYDTAFNGRFGRGAPANGGGGGDAHNAGGGGGANGNNGNAWTGAGVMTNVTGAMAWTVDPEFVANGNALTTSSGGGRGGYTFSGADQNALTVAPGTASWGGDSRRNVGGRGGRPLTADPASRVFLGGGGGAGDGNNTAAGAGGAGGGFVVLIAPTVSGTGSILANGSAGTNSGGNPGDAPGGGGAGGSVIVQSTTLSGVTVRADGGAGGNQTLAANLEAEGPGGGGGGGFIATSGGAVTRSATGALGGTTNRPTLTEFPTNGATSGATGVANGAVGQLPICTTDDLRITNTDGVATVVAGTMVTYTVTVTNAGADIVTGATVTETFPASLINVSWTCAASAGSTCQAATGTGNLNETVTLANGGTVTYTITATVAPATTGTVSTTATVTAPAGIVDPAAANNSATDLDQITVRGDLSIAITDAPDPVAAAGTETYTVTVTNAGPSVATGITVTNTLPAGSSFTSATGTGWACSAVALVVTCTRPTLAPGAAPPIAIVAVMPGTAGMVTDSAVVTSTSTDPNAMNNTATQTTTVAAAADLTVTLTDAPDPVSTSSAVTYTVGVLNVGPQAASTVTATFNVPTGAGFVSATGGGWTCNQAAGVVTCTRPTIASGSAQPITIVVTSPAAAGTMTATASVSATTTDPLPGNNSAMQTTTVTAPTGADLTVSLSDTPDPAFIGTAVTYTLAVTNIGPLAAANLTTTFGVPVGSTFVSAMGTGWACTQAAGVVTCTRPALAVGAAPPITIVVTAPATPGTLTAMASVSSATADPTLGNNSAMQTTTITAGGDTDGDGIPDGIDLDDDDDGIPDTVEQGTDPAADRDGDGVVNRLDLDSDNDGILDVIEVFAGLPDATRNGRLDCPGGVGTNGLCNDVETAPDSGVIDWSNDNLGPDAPIDTDADGIPDFLDIDSDADGIRDLDEGNSGCADVAPSNGRCDGADTDGDGVVDSRDATNGHGVTTYPDRPDTDGDGMPDYRDRDADGDTILDLIEGNSACVDTVAPAGACDGPDANLDGIADDAVATRPDTDGDGRPDYRDVDADGDGLRDNVEGTVDTDGDTHPDFRDLDSDNDGIPDVIEGSSGCVDTTPRNGRCDGPDANNDGLADTATNQTPPDTDSDSAVDFRDLDTDNDGIPDRVEGGSSCVDAAAANAVCDGPDANGDGLADTAVLVAPPNGDLDPVPDFRDLDSDDDGIPDLTEGGSGCTDVSKNAVCDGPDGDRDGIADSIDGAATFGDPTPTIPTNTDGIDEPNYRDLDSNNDATPDLATSGCLDNAAPMNRCDGPDTDGDGVVDQSDGFPGFGIGSDLDGDGVGDSTDLDDDNDGIPDLVEQGVDTDGDGTNDDRDLDSDNDGLPDVVEAGHGVADANRDGTVDCPGGFGANGLCDAVETTPESGMAKQPPIDTDTDGVADFRDLDSDDDGISDRAENGTDCIDASANGVCDGTDPDRDGVVGSADHTNGFGAGGYIVPPDTDNDGLPDYRDLDSDGDSIFDLDEAGFGAFDDDDDGAIDGDDPERDGIKTPVDSDPGFGGGGSGLDTDGDGTPDQRDLDADGDGKPDVDEAGEDPKNPVDTDGDGDPDFQDADSDNDTVTDPSDNCRIDVNTDQLDADGDGMGDECDPDDNNDGFNDGIGLSGGGCTTGGDATGGALAFVLALGMGLAARRRRGAAVLGVVLVATFVSRTASAQVSTSYPAERFQLAAHRDGLLGVPWADVRGHLTIDAALWIGYENDPVNIYQMSDGERVASLVANRFGGELVASVHLFDRLELDVGAPLIVSQSDDVGSFMNPNGDLSGFGLGDLRLTPKLTLVHEGKSPVSLAILLAITLPTSTSDDYGGDNGATYSPAAVISRGGRYGGRISVAGGYRVRPIARALDLIVDDELFAQAGLGYRFANSVEIDGTFDLATAADDALGAFNRNHAELRAGVSADATRLVRLFAAGGAGVAEGFGTPDWRVLAGVRIGSREEPAKKKTIKIVEPPPPPPPVDDDPDKDLIFGDADSCPMEPEDVDSFQDVDGCPDPDNDADTILDVDDACRDVPGVAIMKGCPDPDRDGDTVVDRLDNCPDEPGPVENQGCVAKQLVKIVDGKIDILDVVYFKLNKAVIEKRSYKLLDQVAAVINAHPEITKIRVEGHTDSQGSDASNKKLSQRRADAVMAYLVKKTVQQWRLEAQGFGEDVPKDTNDTKEGRAVNRRVEFTIVGGAGVTVKPTGPDGTTLEP